MFRGAVRIALAGVLLTAAQPVWATATSDPAGDFLATYTGAKNGDLDIVAASVTFDGTAFLLTARVNGTVGASAGSLFVWGINRGAGSARLTLTPPPIGQDVLFDAVAVLFPDGLARVATFPATGAPVITPLPGVAKVSGDTISGAIPVSLLTSTGFTPDAYTFTLWSRLRVNPVADGTNAEIADFAPRLTAAAPEPASWAMLLAGLGVVGAALRRHRRKGTAGTPDGGEGFSARAVGRRRLHLLERGSGHGDLERRRLSDEPMPGRLSRPGDWARYTRLS